MSKLFFKYSVMNAGKSTNLLQQYHNFVSTGQKVLLLKSSVDSRSITIKSGLGIEAPCMIIEPSTNIIELIEGLKEAPNAILVDEAHFLPKHKFYNSDWLLITPILTYFVLD